MKCLRIQCEELFNDHHEQLIHNITPPLHGWIECTYSKILALIIDYFVYLFIINVYHITDNIKRTKHELILRTFVL